MLYAARSLAVLAQDPAVLRHYNAFRQRIVHDQLAHGQRGDLAAARVFDAVDVGEDRRLHLRLFEGKIALLHAAVDQFQAFAVAKRLCPDDRAVLKRHVFAVPGQILALDHTVLYHNVFRVPERILGVEAAVREYGIRNVLEGVLSFQRHMVKDEMVRAHHEIFALGRAVFHFDPANRPAEFRGNNIAVRDPHVRALPKRLDPVHFGVPDRHIFRIPQGRAAIFGHLAVRDRKIMVVPERVAEIKKAVAGLNIAAFLKSALAVRRTVKAAVPNRQSAHPVQRPFLIKASVLNHLHDLFFLYSPEIHEKGQPGAARLLQEAS